eukprot:gnl/TRDRNA2_/TRDRNA2_203615_c0_seq1.p1 gnl/TRDRNA2_/TRDRNA2_203615_c0~~gnl/TRDRNA2_/TRDRNA2_203615_c0_seq1.p1  ORF type:complete len:428 (+),score=43.24 gnl/TRDRNA2_/TRDRNA2_203615_c0_seq1:23-1306(+)
MARRYAECLCFVSLLCFLPCSVFWMPSLSSISISQPPSLLLPPSPGPKESLVHFRPAMQNTGAEKDTEGVNLPSPPPAPLCQAVNLSCWLSDVALQEWSFNSTKQRPKSISALTRDCTDLLHHYDLCTPELLHVPEPHLVYKDETPFMFLHLSKCAGTSLLNKLGHMGYTSFSLKLPPLPAASACGPGISAKCCFWRERLRSWTSDQSAKILQQEPANDQKWIDKNDHVVQAVDPGFDTATDFCPDDLAYLTVLRSPIERVHSHMCEIGANFDMWQNSDTQKRGHVKKQLRDNYYVRSLGGPDAWNAPEGGLQRHHLLAAARALAKFDVVMTVATITSDAAAQMGRVGLPDFQWPHSFSRSRDENLQRAERQASLRTSGVASCELPPTPEQVDRLVAACAWDAVLYEFASLLAARRTEWSKVVGNIT